MPNKDELHVLRIQQAVESALSTFMDSGGITAAMRDGSGLDEVVDSGSYDSDDEYTQYEVSGDICAVYPVGP